MQIDILRLIANTILKYEELEVYCKVTANHELSKFHLYLTGHVRS